VRIDLTGTMPPARGEFTVFGAIADRGTYLDNGGLTFVRTLLGRNGTIRIRVGPRGRWEIIAGTKAYAFLHGRGREAGLYSNPIGITMSGTVSGEPREHPGGIEQSRRASAARVLRYDARIEPEDTARSRQLGQQV
jgi:hypothetical protein